MKQARLDGSTEQQIKDLKLFQTSAISKKNKMHMLSSGGTQSKTSQRNQMEERSPRRIQSI